MDRGISHSQNQEIFCDVFFFILGFRDRFVTQNLNTMFSSLEIEWGDKYIVFDDFDYDISEEVADVTLWGTDDDGLKYEMTGWTYYDNEEGVDWENLYYDTESIIRC